MTEQLRSFKSRALPVVHETSCRIGAGREKQTEAMFDDFIVTVRILEDALKKNSTDIKLIEREFKAGLQSASLSLGIFEIKCQLFQYLNNKGIFNCSVNLDLNYDKRERLRKDLFWSQFKIIKGENTLDTAWTRYTRFDPTGQEEEVMYNVGLTSKRSELETKKERENGGTGYIYRNRVTITERKFGKLESFAVVENSIGKSQPKPFCGPFDRSP